MSIYATAIQIRDNIIKDLKAQIDTLKARLRFSAEDAEDKCRDCLSNDRNRKKTEQMLQAEIEKLTVENETLRKEITEKNKTLEKLFDILGIYKARSKKDSSNSSKPSSTDSFKKTPPKSSRKPSEKRPGGQPGHKGYTMSPNIANAKIVERKEGACDCGGKVWFDENYSSRKLVDIEIIINVTEERAYGGVCTICGKPVKAEHSDEFTAPLKYGDSIKAFSIILNEYGNIPDHKTAEIIRDLSGGAISISPGTVVNFRKYAADAMTEDVELIKQKIKDAEVLCVDETGVNVNGKLCWAGVYATKEHILYELLNKRGDHCLDEAGILAFFIGILMHDHFKAYYRNLAATHSECNPHVLRYLQAVIDIQKHPWAQKMIDFLIGANKRKQELLESGNNALPDGDYENYKKEYIEILDQGDLEYSAAIEGLNNKKRFNEERCLLKRLREYASEHLRFLEDFKAPFGNNDAERAVHKLKNKTRVSGGFRSKVGAEHHMKIASVIMTARLQGKNVLQTILDIFKRNKKDKAMSTGPPSLEKCS